MRSGRCREGEEQVFRDEASGEEADDRSGLGLVCGDERLLEAAAPIFEGLYVYCRRGVAAGGAPDALTG